MKALLIFLIFSFFSLKALSDPCLCPLVSFPICAVENSHFQSFSNECFARCVNYHFAYAGECLPENSIHPDCLSSCSNNLQYVCGQKGNETRTIPNECIAQCQDFTIVKQGTCDNERVLGVGNWWNVAKTAVNEAAKAVADKAKEVADKAKAAIQKAENKTKAAFDAVKNETIKIAEKVKDKVEDLKNKTKEIIAEVKNKTADIAEKISNKTKEVIAEIKNKTKEEAIKINNTFNNLKNKTKIFANKTKEFFKKVANSIKTRLRETKEGLQNCTCHIVDKAEDKVKQMWTQFELDAEKLKNKTKIALNNTKTKIQKLWNQTRDGLIEAGELVAGWIIYEGEEVANKVIVIRAKTNAAFKRTKQWFKNLLGCGCNSKFEPVCIKADEGNATMLNKCYADCGGLTIVNEGKCEEPASWGLELSR